MEQLKEKHCHKCNVSSKEKPLLTLQDKGIWTLHECQDCLKKEVVTNEPMLNRAMAQSAFIEGKKISHDLFSDTEYVRLNQNNEMEDEAGFILDKTDFWLLRGTKEFDKGWFVID